jgi:hypothetical protein
MYGILNIVCFMIGRQKINHYFFDGGFIIEYRIMLAENFNYLGCGIGVKLDNFFNNTYNDRFC